MSTARRSPGTAGRAPSLAAPGALDLLFRVAGACALIALAATLGSLAFGVGAWRVPFVVAHLCALVALLPLGVALVAASLHAGYAERGTPVGAVRAVVARFPVETALVAIAIAGVAVTLSQFDGGLRGARTVANVVTVTAVVVLVVRYLRAARAAR